MNFGNYKLTQRTQKHKLIDLIKRSQTLWNTEGQRQQSLNYLRQAISTLDTIVANETNLQMKKTYSAKQQDLRKRLQERQQGKYKPKQKPEKIPKNQEEQMKKLIISWLLRETPNIKWSEVIGLQATKKALEESLISPNKFPSVLNNNKEPIKSCLIIGPYGTGKSSIGKACTNQINSTFFSVCPSDFIYKNFYGDNSQSVKILFSVAKEKKPSVILIDEIEATCGVKVNEKYRKIKAQLMAEIEQISKNDTGVIVICQSHQPWLIDSDLRKVFQLRLYTSLPDFNARLQILKKNLQQSSQNLTEEDFIQFAKKTEGYTGSDLRILAREAIFQPLRKIQQAKKFKPVGNKWTPCQQNEDGKSATWLDFKNNQFEIEQPTKDNVLRCIIKTKPSLDQKDLSKYEKFEKEFGQDG